MTARNVIVTGGARGIGRAMAQGLLEDGHRLVIFDLNAGALAQCREVLGADGVRYVEGSVTSEPDCARAVADAVDGLGGLDAIVNNAGIGMSEVRPDAEVNHPTIEELAPEIYQRFFDINVLGAVRMTRAGLAPMKAAGWGRIINNSTSYLTMHRVLPYGAVKAALESMSSVWAKALDGTGVTVNVVVPGGPTDTEFVVDIGLPREKMLRPAVMAPPVRWLMSDEANGMTGRRFVAGHWDTAIAPAAAAAKICRAIAWPELTGDAIWGVD